MRVPASRTEGKFYLLCLLLLCTGVTMAQAVAPAGVQTGQDSKSVALRKYEVLKTRVMGSDLSVDWREFRLAAAMAEVDGGVNWQSSRELVLSDVDAGNLDRALVEAQRMIARNMAAPQGHLLAMTVFQKLGRYDEAQREQSIVAAIVKSIMSSGDGQSAQKAWFTVSNGEEEFIVDIVLEAEARSHAQVRSNGHAFDEMTVVGDDGVEHILWFNTDTGAQIASAELRAAR